MEEKEKNERMRKEEREFQLRVFSMMCSQSPHKNYQFPSPWNHFWNNGREKELRMGTNYTH